jgi:CO dehydrogenase/acetyl-CoA synthase delta subunit
VVKKVADAIDVPSLVWGTANDEKDGELLRRVAEAARAGMSPSVPFPTRTTNR